MAETSKKSRRQKAREKLRAAGAGAGKAGLSTAKGFWSGFTYIFKGAKFVYLSHIGLITIWIWPVLITIASIIALTFAIAFWHGDLLTLMWSEPTGEGGWATFLRVLRPIVQVLLFLILLVVGIFGVYLMTSVLSGPFNGMLSERVEKLQTDGESAPSSTFMEGLALTIRLEVGKLLVYAVVMVPAFVLSLLIPFVGQAIYVVFGVVFTMIFFAVDFTDWPLANRGYGARYRLRLVRAHLLRMFGLGTGVWLFFLIPFLNLLFMPAAVAGGTLMVLDMEQEGLLPTLAGKEGDQAAPLDAGTQQLESGGAE